jgi:hypothetical protein
MNAEEFSGYPFRKKEEINLGEQRQLAEIGVRLNEILEDNPAERGELFDVIEEIMESVLEKSDIDILHMYFGIGEYSGQKFTLKQIGEKHAIVPLSVRNSINWSIAKIVNRIKWLKNLGEHGPVSDSKGKL